MTQTTTAVAAAAVSIGLTDKMIANAALQQAKGAAIKDGTYLTTNGHLFKPGEAAKIQANLATQAEKRVSDDVRAERKAERIAAGQAKMAEHNEAMKTGWSTNPKTAANAEKQKAKGAAIKDGTYLTTNAHLFGPGEAEKITANLATQASKRVSDEVRAERKAERIAAGQAKMAAHNDNMKAAFAEFKAQQAA